MCVRNDKHYVGVKELQRRVDSERSLTAERRSLEGRVNRWNAGNRSGDSYERLTSDVRSHNDAIRAHNSSIRNYKACSSSTPWYRTPGAWRR